MQATIHNEFLTLTVDTHGAEAVSLKMPPGRRCSGRPTRLYGSAHAPILSPGRAS